MWYSGGKESPHFRSADVTYLDGSRPLVGSRVPPCPYCGVDGGLVRCFDEDAVYEFASPTADVGALPNVGSEALAEGKSDRTAS